MDPKRDVKCKIGKVLSPEWSVEEVVVWAQNSLPVKVRTLYGKVEQFLSGVAIYAAQCNCVFGLGDEEL